MTPLLQSLSQALGPGGVVTGDAISEKHFCDQSKLAPQPPAALLLPVSTEEVAACLRLCHAAKQPVVVQGGMTGVAGGAIPQPGEFALSLERLTGIEEIDLDGRCMVAKAGTPLAEIQLAASNVGLHCGIDLGSRGSCTIGGNVATNAGGNHVVRYGMTRRNLLGLEAVLADGSVISHLNRMLKDNTGYDWAQLLAGSEGTLAVITRVVVSLHPQPRNVHTALCAVEGVPALHALRKALGAGAGQLLTFEAMWREYMDIAIDGLGLAQPFAARPEITLLVELEGMDEDAFEQLLAAQMENGVIVDAIVARSLADATRLWSFREATYSYARLRPRTAAYDVSIPHNRMEEFVGAFREAIAVGFPAAQPMFFGHFADGNLHLSIAQADLDKETSAGMDTAVYAIIARLGGSVSAEHGIGLAKRSYLSLSRSEDEIRVMRRLKLAMDPAQILNPDRILRISDHAEAR